MNVRYKYGWTIIDVARRFLKFTPASEITGCIADWTKNSSEAEFFSKRTEALTLADWLGLNPQNIFVVDITIPEQVITPVSDAVPTRDEIIETARAKGAPRREAHAKARKAHREKPSGVVIEKPAKKKSTRAKRGRR